MALNMQTTKQLISAPRDSKLSSDSITFKVYSTEHDENRLFLMPRQCTTFQAVAARIVELFGFDSDRLPINHMQVQYQDDEHDLVTITTDEELRTALQLFSGKPSIRLVVSVKKNSAIPVELSKASEIITIEPDHAESVVTPVNRNCKVVESVTLEEASEKLPFVAVMTPTTIISGASPSLVLVPTNEMVDSTKAVESSAEPKRGKAYYTKEERIQAREARMAMRAKRESMSAGLQKLEELGFHGKRGHCIRLLLKYDGDVDMVANEMKAWAQAKEAREKLKAEREEKKRLKEEYKAKKALVHAQKKELIEDKRKRRELRCDKKMLKEELKQERCLKKAEKIEMKKMKKERKQLLKAGFADDQAFEEFESQLAQLESMGFKCRHRNVRMLKKFDGQVDKVIDVLAYKDAERLHAYAEKHGLAEYEATHKAAFEKLAALGIIDQVNNNNKRLVVRLLKQCDGDVDKVILHLNIIEERKRHRAAMAKLLATAQQEPVIVNRESTTITA